MFIVLISTVALEERFRQLDMHLEKAAVLVPRVHVIRTVV
jgi:hypothetical protein